MDYLIEKYLGEEKKISKSIIGKIIDFIDARHMGNAKQGLKLHKELKKKLGNSFSKTLMKFGDPDDPNVGYTTVRNQWAMLLQGKNEIR